MGPHEGVERPQGAELAPLVLRHPLEHRSLAVHHFVVADRQDEVLRVRVRHGEGHLVVVVLPVDRFAAEIAQRVVHPAHVPLEAEAQAAVLHAPGHTRPGRGFLRDHHDPGLAPIGVRIHRLNEVDGLEVLVAAELVRDPLPLVAGVVEIEHRGHAVHPQPVDVELVEPVVGVGDQEALHLVAAEVEDVGAPVRMPAQARIFVLVQRGAVEPLQRPRVGGEVPGDPVDDHADTGFVQGVDQVPELVRRSEAGDGREVAGDVVAPGTLVRMLGGGHQLHVGVALPADVLHQLVGQFEVGETTTPRTQVHLVDADRLLVLLLQARGSTATVRRSRRTGSCRRSRRCAAQPRRTGRTGQP